MTPSTRLGGFKILKNVLWVSLVYSQKKNHYPVHFFSTIARAKINLPYISCVKNASRWGVNIVVDRANGSKIIQVLDGAFGKSVIHHGERAILSIFPHRKNPGITGSLFLALHQGGVEPDALANSPSAISVILDKDAVDKAGKALFEPFSFGPYRTPEDWQLAQKGKEELYREVVASYQEQKPKVYGLECYEGQEMIHITLNNSKVVHLEPAFKAFARLGLSLTFLATGPEQGNENTGFTFCLPRSEKEVHTRMVKDLAPESTVKCLSPVSVFSMNGPHFGDRFGIASELLTALQKNDIELLGLSCTIASVTGVVRSHQIDSAILAIQGCFDVPNLIRKA